MSLSKQQKQKVVEDLREKIAKAQAIILVGISGLKVKDVSELRKRLKAVDSEAKVAKKTLAELVLKENKLDFDKNKFKEEVAFIFAYKDELLSTKTIYQFSKEKENLKILGGFIENKFKEAEEIIILAQLPSREELLARFVGTISSPISSFVNVLRGNIKGLIYALSAIKK